MRSGGGSQGAVLQLEIAANEMLNVQAVDFVLTFPANLLRYDGFTRGDFLGAGAQLIPGGGGSALSFDILRTAPSPASGSGVIITLNFTAVGAGTGRIDFVDPVAEDAFGLDVPGVDWIGSAVRVVL